MVKLTFFRAFLLFLSLILLQGCGSNKSSLANNILQRTWSETQASPVEKTYCSTPIIHASNHTITGQAKYQYRPVGIELGEEGLREISTTSRAIRHAQYDVTDANGTVLQCGETDGAGMFSLTVPKNNRALSLNIYTRSNNVFNKASIFIAPETNELHKLQFFFTANKSQSNLTLTADADETLIGGAFNILDQVHNSFDKLQNSVVFGQGIAPQNIPKVDIYWEKGFNPGVYVGVSSGLSFFSKPQRKLFILGGLNGDTDFSDTDHFDNSIVLHEYFHFLETTVSLSNSPGGPHNGNQLVDPRLAWSEGAAQFYQAFITGIPSVLDTRGNIDGSTGFLLKFSVESETNDFPQVAGEGEFREFAVARVLWDLQDSENGEAAPESFDRLEDNFANFWRAFTGTEGFNNTEAHFASLGLLLDSMSLSTPSIDTSFDWYEVLTESFIPNPIATTAPGGAVINAEFSSFRSEYSQLLRAGGAGSLFNFTGPFSFLPNPAIINNHPVASINSYSIHVPANASTPISFTSTTENSASGQDGLLQMYILSDGYTNLSNFIHGPIATGVSVNLPGGTNGQTYLIAVVISIRPQKDSSGNEVIMRYEFPGFTAGRIIP